MILNRKGISLLLLLLVLFISCEKEEIADITQKTELDKLVDSEFKRLLMPGLVCLAVKDDMQINLGKNYSPIKPEC